MISNSSKTSLLGEIARVQAGDGTSNNITAPVKIQIGFIARESNTVLSNGIVILDAPPTVVKAIMKWIEARNEDPESLKITASMYDGGLLVC
jgi:hypothetical protein